MAGQLDPEQGWGTQRLLLQPLLRGHAAELFGGLNDPGLHEFIGGAPLALAELTERYARLQSRRSGDGREVWCNWVLRARASGQLVGTVQATLGTDGTAQIAWVVVRHAQRRGYAGEAAVSMVDRLCGLGWTVQAFVHPEHLASQRVARRAGLHPTDRLVDGEVCWERTAAPG